MSDQNKAIEIAQQMEQWALDFSTDEDHDVFLGWAREVRRLHDQLVKCHAVLEQCQYCIRGETPEDMTHEEAREDTISKIREIILTDEKSQP